MADGPNIVRIATLIGDHTRASMLTALMRGQALTATELATEADITKQTASSHLSQLVDAGLVSVQAQGRHRYFQLAAPDVGALLEGLMGVAERTGARRVRPGPRDPALRKARVCYDHLAGELAVEMYDALLSQKLLRLGRSDGAETLVLTSKGESFFADRGLDVERFRQLRRPVCRPCLDWSARRHHLAGTLGKELLEHCYAKRWARRVEGTRVVNFTARGEQALRNAFSC